MNAIPSDKRKALTSLLKSANFLSTSDQASTDPGTQQTPEQIAAAAAQTPEQKAAAEAAAQPKPITELMTATDAAWAAYETNPTPESKQAYLDAKKAEKESVTKDIEARKQDAEKNKVPDNYTLTKPEKSLLSDEAVARIAAFAKEQGLTNDKAQALLNRESQVVADARQQFSVEADAKLGEMQKTWITTAKDDQEIGGANFAENAEVARRVLATFGTPEFNAVLADPKQGGFGNHPELVRIFTRIGKAMGEDKLVNPGAQGDKNLNKPFADKFYEQVTPTGSGVQT